MARPVSALTTFIRSLPTDLPAKDVLAQAKVAGHETSESNVSRVRAEMAKAKTAPKRVAKKAPTKAAPKKRASSKTAAKKRTSTTKAATAKKAPAKKVTLSPGTAKSAGTTKSAFIRLHPSLSAAEVIAAGRAQGLSFSSALVYAVRGPKGSGKKAAKKQAGKLTSTTSVAKGVAKTATSKKPPVNKADFVRARAHLSPKEIVEDAQAQGIDLSTTYVYNVRGAGKAAGKKRGAKKAPVLLNAGTFLKAVAPSNGTRPSGSVEDLLKAAAAELGLARAIEILQAERARVRAVIGG
jgi:hypothetical protein